MITAPELLQIRSLHATARRLRRVLVAVAIVPVAIGLGLGAGGRVTADAAPCVVDGAVSADAAERQIRNCLELAEIKYTACMLDAPGTADSLERWVEYCRTTTSG